MKTNVSVYDKRIWNAVTKNSYTREYLSNVIWVITENFFQKENIDKQSFSIILTKERQVYIISNVSFITDL